MADILSSIDFLKFAIPLLGTIIAWFVNEWRKRVADQYLRKEANYKELLRSLRGFYKGASNANELKLEFLTQLNISWLYCSDEIIRKGYEFLKTVDTKKPSSKHDSELALGAFVAAIRQDLLSRKIVRRTAMSGADFKHLSVNNA